MTALSQGKRILAFTTEIPSFYLSLNLSGGGNCGSISGFDFYLDWKICTLYMNYSAYSDEF